MNTISFFELSCIKFTYTHTHTVKWPHLNLHRCGHFFLQSNSASNHSSSTEHVIQLLSCNIAPQSYIHCVLKSLFVTWAIVVYLPFVVPGPAVFQRDIVRWLPCIGLRVRVRYGCRYPTGVGTSGLVIEQFFDVGGLLRILDRENIIALLVILVCLYWRSGVHTHAIKKTNRNIYTRLTAFTITGECKAHLTTE